MKRHQLDALRALLEKIEGNDSKTEKMRSIIGRIEKEATGLFELVSKPDPMKSAVAIDLLINQEKAKLRDVVAQSRVQLTNIVADSRHGREFERMQKADLRPDDFASEIRTAFRSLDATSKLQFMTDAIKARDRATVAAIVMAPPLLSGLPAEQIANYRESYLDAIGPNQKNEADEMQDLVDAVCNTAEAAAQPVGSDRQHTVLTIAKPTDKGAPIADVTSQAA